MKSKMTLPLATMIAATSASGCYSTWDITPKMLVELDGFQASTPKNLRIPGSEGIEEVPFTHETRLHFVGSDGVQETAQFSSIRVQGPIFTGIETETGDRLRVDTRQLKAVELANFSAGRTALATTGFLAGMAPVGTAIFFGVFFAVMSGGGEGRPLRVDGQSSPIAAPLAFNHALRERARTSRTHDVTRDELFARWAKAASDECASIPAFLALARDLARASAPMSLVRAALQAAREEANHTDLCTKLANEHGAHSITALTPAVPTHNDADAESLLRRLALEAFWDGCVAEGAAAAVARRSAFVAKDEKIRLALQTIAHDETNHARLAEQILAYCLSAGGRSIRHALRESFERKRADEETQMEMCGPDEPLVDVEFAQRHGWAGNESRRAARIETWEKSVSMLARI